MIDRRSVTLAGGESPAIRFQVPEGAVAVGITVVGQPDEIYRPCHWTGGDGVELVPRGWRQAEPNATGRCVTCAVRLQESQEVFAAATPSSPEAPVAPGEHELAVCGEGPTAPSTATVEVTVHVKVDDTALAGRLDLDLFFTGAGGWTAATAPDDQALAAVLDHVSTIFGQADIALGEVAYHDIDDRFRMIEDGELRELLASERGGTAAAVDVMFVDHLIDIIDVAGKSAGLPGPFVAGTPHTGVVVALDRNGVEELTIEQIVAHEAGHYLGLWHTVEALDFIPDDPLADTGEDESNLMHFGTLGTEVTPDQASVLRASPYICAR